MQQTIPSANKFASGLAPDPRRLRRTHMDLAELEPHGHISALFDNAKEVDEFEYCSMLLRIRGIKDHGWDPLRESESNYE